MGSFDREIDRILYGHWQIKVYRLHTHAGTHIFSFEITNKLLIWETDFYVDLIFFLHFLVQCYEGLKAVLSYIFHIAC